MFNKFEVQNFYIRSKSNSLYSHCTPLSEHELEPKKGGQKREREKG